jgi:hypothetical protein
MVRTFADALLDIARRLNASGMLYAISGGVAKSLYGLPAMTKDVDVLALADHDRFEAVFRPDFRLLASDAFEDASGFIVEFYPASSTWERAMLERAEERPLDGLQVKVLEPHDWAAVKLREARIAPTDALRHFADVREVAAFLRLDMHRLEQTAALVGAQAQFKAWQGAAAGAP